MLIDCVEGGASVSFMFPMSRAKAEAFWLVAAERSALDAGKTLLVLDTVTGGDAERLYARQGWQRCGEIPIYALWPDGTPCATTIFFKLLRN